MNEDQLSSLATRKGGVPRSTRLRPRTIVPASELFDMGGAGGISGRPTMRSSLKGRRPLAAKPTADYIDSRGGVDSTDAGTSQTAESDDVPTRIQIEDTDLQAELIKHLYLRGDLVPRAGAPSSFSGPVGTYHPYNLSAPPMPIAVWNPLTPTIAPYAWAAPAVQQPMVQMAPMAAVAPPIPVSSVSTPAHTQSATSSTADSLPKQVDQLQHVVAAYERQCRQLMCIIVLLIVIFIVYVIVNAYARGPDARYRRRSYRTWSHDDDF